jgi:phosphonopyruvate decarboxylase
VAELMSLNPAEDLRVLESDEFTSLLRREGFDFASGVPCSLIEGVLRNLETRRDIIYAPAVREDVAVGLAAGAWLAGRRPAVLMQNSGLGTSLNALASLSLMYGLPLLLVVTWRGHGGKDAPEHILTGAITEPLLELLGIPHRVLSAASAASDVAWAAAEMDRRSAPVALVVPPGLFADESHGDHIETALPRDLPVTHPLRQIRRPLLSRSAAIAAAVKQLDREAVIHANGYPSRESQAISDRPQNFYMLGSMGLASAIGLGLALARPTLGTVIFDGDGNLLMSLGILPMVAAYRPARFVHCVFDNEVYGSTGNQRTISGEVRLDRLAESAGYRSVAAVTKPAEITEAVASAVGAEGPHFVLVKVTPEQMDAPRIPYTPNELRDRFMRGLATGTPTPPTLAPPRRSRGDARNAPG